MGNVMEHAGRENQIKGACVVRDFLSREHRILFRPRETVTAQRDAAFRLDRQRPTGKPRELLGNQFLEAMFA